MEAETRKDKFWRSLNGKIKKKKKKTLGKFGQIGDALSHGLG
jgi:hypothetical protein